MVKAERNGTVIVGVDAPLQGVSSKGTFDLQPDPAGLRDMASRLRNDAELMPDKAAKARLLASAEEAEARAEQVELSAFWAIPRG